MIGKIIKDAYKQKYGGYPVLHIEEIYRGEDYEGKSGGEFYIDIAKLESIGDSELRYVEGILRIPLNKGTKDSRTFETEASAKYSFSDEEEWWRNSISYDHKNRMIIYIDVTLTL
jgi:uncharacterized membrane protein